MPARSSSRSLPSGPGTTSASMRCSTCSALRTVPPYMPECRSRAPVRTSICAIAMPRSPSVIAGVCSSTMPESKTIAASAPRSSPRIHSVMRLGARFLLALDDHADVDRQLAGARHARTPRTAAARSCPCRRRRRARRAGRRAPRARTAARSRREVADALHVVVAVDEDRRRVLPRGAEVADDERVAVADLHELDARRPRARRARPPTRRRAAGRRGRRRRSRSTGCAAIRRAGPGGRSWRAPYFLPRALRREVASVRAPSAADRPRARAAGRRRRVRAGAGQRRRLRAAGAARDLLAGAAAAVRLELRALHARDRPHPAAARRGARRAPGAGRRRRGGAHDRRAARGERDASGCPARAPRCACTGRRSAAR